MSVVRVMAVALLVALSPAVVQAQIASGVEVGDRVRVWVPEPHLQREGPWRRQQLRGVVAAIAGDTLLLSVPGADGTLAIRATIRRLDVSRGHPSRAASAVERAIGFAVVGAVTVALDNDPNGSEWPNYHSDRRAAAEGAKWGAVFGAAFGLGLPTERWRRVRLSR